MKQRTLLYLLERTCLHFSHKTIQFSTKFVLNIKEIVQNQNHMLDIGITKFKGLYGLISFRFLKNWICFENVQRNNRHFGKICVFHLLGLISLDSIICLLLVITGKIMFYVRIISFEKNKKNSILLGISSSVCFHQSS